MRTVKVLPGFLLLGVMLMSVSGAGGVEPASQDTVRQRLQNTLNAGNFKDAYEGLRELTLNPNCDPLKVGDDLQMAVQALQRLNRVSEIDGFREAVIAVHKANWRLLWKAAQTYQQVPHQGFIIAGKFERGRHRGGGEVANAAERDRVRALQLMAEAAALARQDAQRAEVAGFFLAFGQMFQTGRGYREAWRLQDLTDLTVLPDYEPGWGYYSQTRGAPVDEKGNPVLYRVPRTFEDARSDGERWRWCLTQAAEFNAQLLGATRMQWANFLHEQFGVQTMAKYGWFFGRSATDDTADAESGTYALHTLGENETIARLASGIRRFPLPDEFNFIKIYQQLAEEDPNQRNTALERLAQIFENRRQYPRAAEYWRRRIQSGWGSKQHYQDRLRQIEGNWGRFEPVVTQPAGKGATVEYRFRNGRSVEFVAHEILAGKLLEDVKSYIKSRPRQLNWEKLNIGDLGYRLVQKDEGRYRGP